MNGVQPCPKRPGDAEFSLWPLPDDRIQTHLTELSVGMGILSSNGGPVLGFWGSRPGQPRRAKLGWPDPVAL